MDYLLFVLIFFALIFDRLNIFFFFVVSSLLHEAGHIFACMLCKTKPKIEVSVFGFKLSAYPQKKWQKLFVLISGPLINVILILISSYCLSQQFNLKLYVFSLINMVIAAFNILPLNFLDGGQIVALFCDKPKIRNMLDIISFVSVILTIFFFSDNLLFSTMALILFAIYYCINKNNLH